MEDLKVLLGVLLVWVFCLLLFFYYEHNETQSIKCYVLLYVKYIYLNRLKCFLEFLKTLICLLFHFSLSRVLFSLLALLELRQSWHPTGGSSEEADPGSTEQPAHVIMTHCCRHTTCFPLFSLGFGFHQANSSNSWVVPAHGAPLFLTRKPNLMTQSRLGFCFYSTATLITLAASELENDSVFS